MQEIVTRRKVSRSYIDASNGRTPELEYTYCKNTPKDEVVVPRAGSLPPEEYYNVPALLTSVKCLHNWFPVAKP